VRIATIRTNGRTAAARLDDEAAVVLDAVDLGALLAQPDWAVEARTADGPRLPLDQLDFAPLVVRPEKVICVGLNYRAHIAEMGRDFPEYPTLFPKYARTLIGAYDDIILPAASTQVDWEAELAFVIGSEVRHGHGDAARAAIAGYTVLNDISERDWQYRTPQWLQGKSFEATTPVGPWLVTADEPGVAEGHAISCAVDGELMQKADTADLLFDPVALVEYISTFITLAPGDLIATGTPAGVGAARTPPRFLQAGEVVTTEISGIGTLRNTCRPEGTSAGE
jgi:acylpyruvate hydrolase